MIKFLKKVGSWIKENVFKNKLLKITSKGASLFWFYAGNKDKFTEK